MHADVELEPLFDPEQLDLLRDALGTEELAAMLVRTPGVSPSDIARRHPDRRSHAEDLDGARKGSACVEGIFVELRCRARLSSIARAIELEAATIAVVAECLADA